MQTFLRASAVAAAILFLAYGFGVSNEQTDGIWLLCLAGAGACLVLAFWPAGTRALPIFSRTLLRWTTLIAIAFLLVTIQLVRVQIVESSHTAARVVVAPNGDVAMDPRQRIRALEVRRGRILDSEGRVLADTVQRDDGTWQRTWPEPSTAGLIGYYSPLLYGASNLESKYDAYLSGEEGGNPVVEWFDAVLHKQPQGYDLRLSIDLDLQQIASELLNGRPGGVVLMDPTTGAVLAMTGAPEFDPNRLYANEGQQSDEDLAAIQAYWAELNADSEAPLVFRPTQGLYNPGSTFKSVSASALLDSGLASPDTVYRDEGALNVDGRIIEELNRPDPDKVNWTLEESFAWSLNVVFAQVGMQLTADRMWEYASRFGFGDEIPFDIPTSASQVATDRGDLNTRTLLADTGFGQGEILASPLQMAMIVSAIENGGTMTRPWLVDEALQADGDVAERFSHHDWRDVIASDTAENMRRLMQASADYGYASAAKFDGAVVGAKTGTAELGEGEPHSWFIGWAEAGGRKLVVAVVVEHGGPGSQAALPIGRALLAAGLGLAAE